MDSQTIVAIEREYGSGGHNIAEKVAENLGFKYYDRSMLDEIAKHMDVNTEMLAKFDEKPKTPVLSRRVGKYTNSMEEILAEYQFEFIRKKAESGESFVIVGRCANSVLKGTKGLITAFISSDRDFKIKRIMEEFGIDESEAIAKIMRHDIKRKRYHNRYSTTRWADINSYDICMKSHLLGIDKTADILTAYIRERMNTEAEQELE